MIGAVLILAAMLHGFKDEHGFNKVKRRVRQWQKVLIADINVAIEATRHDRELRSFSVAEPGTGDALFAIRYLANGLRLLHGDQELVAF